MTRVADGDDRLDYEQIQLRGASKNAITIRVDVEALDMERKKARMEQIRLENPTFTYINEFPQKAAYQRGKYSRTVRFNLFYTNILIKNLK